MLRRNTKHYERFWFFFFSSNTEINITMSMFSLFREVGRDVVKCMFRMSEILITAKYESLPGGG